MPLEKYEDFLDLSVKELQNYLAVRGMTTSGRKVELVARAFAAFELKMSIISSSEEQKQTLERDYKLNLKKYDLDDPNLVEGNKRLNDVTKWPVITLGNIFAYILDKKMCDKDYIGRYKDQKAFSYWDSGFVGPITIHVIKKNVSILYCSVTASQTMSDTKDLWIAVNTINDKGSNVMTAWCSCMAGSYQCCNHVIACLYKIDYANVQGLCKPACTETACAWNKNTRRNVTPMRISDLVVRKKLATVEAKKHDSIPREEKRMKDLQEFDPRAEHHRDINTENLSNFIRKVQVIKKDAVLFKSIETMSNTVISDHSGLLIENLKEKALLNAPTAQKTTDTATIEQETTEAFVRSLCATDIQIKNLEYATRNQSKQDLWHQARKGRLTASNHHTIYTKMNSVVKATGLIKPKTTPLVAATIFGKKPLNNDATKWGIQNEEKALKAYYANELPHHNDLKVTACGLFLLKNCPYIAASPDGLVTCKCHNSKLIEIKCPYSIRNKTIADGYKQCDFLKTIDDKIQLNKNHKYYTQVISQMAVTGIHECSFIVWTLCDIFVQTIHFDNKHWEKVKSNLVIFYKSYVCPALLEFKPVTYCAKCDDVLLEEKEIETNEEKQLNSIQCDSCSAWFHYKCENVKVETDLEDWLCSMCLMSMLDEH